MKKFTLFIFASVLVILQLSVLDVFFGFQKSPNVVLAFIVCLTVLIGFRDSLGWIIFSGLLLDAGVGWLLGTSALLFVFISWATESLGYFSDIKSLRRLVLFPTLSAILIFSVFAYDWAGFWIFELENHFWTKQKIILSFHLDSDFFWRAVFTALSGLAVYSLMKRMRSLEIRSGPGTVKRAAR